VPRLASFSNSCWSTQRLAFLAPEEWAQLPAGALTHRVEAMDWLVRQRHHSPVQQRCRNIDHDTTLEWGAESTRQDGNRTGGPMMFHLDQPPIITHEANR
jgi:hypothetical protein